MRISLNSKNLERTLENIAQYSFGFIEGAKRGKSKFLQNLGVGTIEALSQYIDLEARSNPAILHHVYEWYRVGSPQARLFDLSMTVSNLGLSIKSNFKQSTSVKVDSNTPFYNKAYIMENGIPVKITPKKSALAFKAGGETVFTKNSVMVENPGGTEVQGAYERIFNEFMRLYFTQSFLKASGIFDYIQNPVIYKKNMKSGAKGGKSAGVKTGYTWIVNAKVGIE